MEEPEGVLHFRCSQKKSSTLFSENLNERNELVEIHTYFNHSLTVFVFVQPLQLSSTKKWITGLSVTGLCETTHTHTHVRTRTHVCHHISLCKERRIMSH